MVPRFVLAASCFLGFFLQACVADHLPMILCGNAILQSTDKSHSEHGRTSSFWDTACPTPSQTPSPTPRPKLDQDGLRIVQIYTFRSAKGSDPVTSMAFSPSGSILAVAFGESHVQTWNLQMGEPVHRYPQGGAATFSRMANSSLLHQTQFTYDSLKEILRCNNLLRKSK